jgi:plastocyanin
MGVATAAGVLAVAGCGGGGSSSSSSTSGGSRGPNGSSGSAASGGGSTLKLAADPSGRIAFDTTKLSAKAGQVTVRFTNRSSTPHAVEIEGKGVEKSTKVLTQGNATLTANLKPGTYTFYCPVGNHRQEGMEGTLTVK